MDDGYDEVIDNYVGTEEIDSLWNLAEDFSVCNAASLVAGYNPVMVEQCKNDTYFHRTFSKYPIALKALTNAITNSRVKATLRYSAREYGYADQRADLDLYEGDFMKGFGTTAEEDETFSNDHSCFYKLFPDWSLSTISRDNLMEWLRSRGIHDGYFFQSQTKSPDYLDPKNPRYAPKLAAAVRAWQAVTDPNGKHPKQALTKWLREHAAEFGLSDEEGKPNETGIEEVAKVTNWQPGGGAPKTPG